MSGNKRVRKNRYKRSFAKRYAGFIRCCVLCFKIASGVTILTFFSLIFIFAYDLLTQCDYFKAEKIIVSGAERLSLKEILEQAQIKNNVNILSVNLSISRKRLLSHPWIAKAEVMRDLPDRLIIKITEHKPVAILDLGRKFIINDFGKIFKEMSAADALDLPVINGLDFSDINLAGEQENSPIDAVMEVLHLGNNGRSILCGRSIERIDVDREIGITIFTSLNKSGSLKSIKLGYNNYPAKYERLEEIFRYLKKEQMFSDIISIDLNNLARIVVNPAIVKSPA